MSTGITLWFTEPKSDGKPSQPNQLSGHKLPYKGTRNRTYCLRLGNTTIDLYDITPEQRKDLIDLLSDKKKEI